MATLNIAAPVTLTVNQTTNTNFAGTLINSGTLVKSGSGTLEFDAPPTLGPNSSLLVNAGRLRFSTSSSGAVGAGVSATIAAGATLELAGTASALAAGAYRVNVTDNGLTANSVLLVTGTNQQVGNIDGTGSVNVNAGASLTANHINQAALIIGGASGNSGSVVIAPSDANGNALVDASASAPTLAGPLASTEPFGADAPTSPLPLPALSSVEGAGEGPWVRRGTTIDTASTNGATSSISIVPEPTSAFLSCLAAVIGLVLAISRRRSARQLSTDNRRRTNPWKE
jgi:hypothetical protein